jgi:hypothetical protein
MTYFGVSYFSPYPALSVPLFLGVIAGGVIWVRAERRQGLVLAGFPLVFLAVFCLQNSAMMVRNYLLLAPFFALLLARAVGALVAALPRPWLRAPVFAALAGVALVNATFIVNAAESIRHRNLERDMRDAIVYLAESGSSFRLSPRLAQYASKNRLPRGRRAKEKFDRVAFLAQAEGPNPFKWPANDPWQAERVFGPLEMNFDWYPTWGGEDRVVVMSLAKAKGIGLHMLER